jgi:hypothetical protein
MNLHDPLDEGSSFLLRRRLAGIAARTAALRWLIDRRYRVVLACGSNKAILSRAGLAPGKCPGKSGRYGA